LSDRPHLHDADGAREESRTPIARLQGRPEQVQGLPTCEVRVVDQLIYSPLVTPGDPWCQSLRARIAHEKYRQAMKQVNGGPVCEPPLADERASGRKQVGTSQRCHVFGRIAWEYLQVHFGDGSHRKNIDDTSQERVFVVAGHDDGALYHE
jgi:hypothetical protein